MLRGRVVGSVWSTRRLELPPGTFLEVEIQGTRERIVAFDVMGSGIGERVFGGRGSVAAAWVDGGKKPPIDALIIGSIDDVEIEEAISEERPVAAGPSPNTTGGTP